MSDLTDADPSEIDADDTGGGARRRFLIIGLAGFIVVAGVLFVALGGSGDDTGGEGHLDIAFTLPDGEQVVLADFAGEAMIVNFFASWCGPCRAEMPDFEDVHQQLGDEVRFVGLSTDTRQADAEEIVADTGITYLWGRDANADIFDAYGGAVMPTTVFVTADGEIVEVHGGILTADDLTQRALALLG